MDLGSFFVSLPPSCLGRLHYFLLDAVWLCSSWISQPGMVILTVEYIVRLFHSFFISVHHVRFLFVSNCCIISVLHGQWEEIAGGRHCRSGQSGQQGWGGNWWGQKEWRKRGVCGRGRREGKWRGGGRGEGGLRAGGGIEGVGADGIFRIAARPGYFAICRRGGGTRPQGKRFYSCDHDGEWVEHNNTIRIMFYLYLFFW